MDNNSAEKVQKVLRKIRELRKTKGLSHENIAIELDMSPSAYNKLERGETTLSLERLLKIAEIFEINIGEILDIQTKNQFNQINRESSTGYLQHQEIQNMHQDNKEVYDKLIASKDEQIALLKAWMGKE
jgi:transcriptional regulator with XRE-family HTH domain